MSDDNATLPSSVLPSSTVQHNIALDLEILRQEPYDAITKAAPWWQRRFASMMSTVSWWTG